MILLPILVVFKNPAIALFVGSFFTLLLGRPLLPSAMEYGKVALQAAIVLLGLSLNLQQLWGLSADYSGLVTGYVLATLLVGLLIGRLLAVDSVSGKLVSSATAICGGTAVATLSPVLRAEPRQTGAILAVIFILNAVALFTFPAIGHWLDLSQTQFGLWCALAIHDTASVVATAALYGEQAMEVATTLKLGRTLWLIPLLLFFSMAQGQSARLRIPPFILLFVLASMLGSLAPLPGGVVVAAAWSSKALLVVALFLVGCEIGRDTLRQIEARVLWQALALWLLVAPLALLVVLRLTA